ncbi:MAG: hypothetical protein Q9194_002566 [Teloschistes cf. exilis]
MPHVRRTEYPKVNSSYVLEYVEIIHRHHKRTPYAANTFPVEAYSWYCDNEALFYYGAPLPTHGANHFAHTYWSVYTSSSNPLAPRGFNGSCLFPQITREGLDDSWQHGSDLYGVYHNLLKFLPEKYDPDVVSFRVTNNVITSQVASMVTSGMFGGDTQQNLPLLVQPASIDSLEPAYTCLAANNNFSSYGVGSDDSGWTSHLKAASDLYANLDTICGIPPTEPGFHMSFDHYFDNLSARLCHAKPLPCNASNTSLCVTQAMADEVFRLGQYEYSYLYRDAGARTLEYSTGSYGIWIAELAQNLRDAMHPIDSVGTGDRTSSDIRYRHNIAHDGSVSRILSILQIEEMVWPGMGSEVIFELYKKTEDQRYYIRVLWGGQVLRSSNPILGVLDMLPIEILVAYIDGLVELAIQAIDQLDMTEARDIDTEKLTALERTRLYSAVRRKPRFLVIGAGQRGTAYASAVGREALPAIIAATADPIPSKRISFGKRYIWKDGTPREDQVFDSWQQFLRYERSRQETEATGEKVYAGVDGIILCTQDQTHKRILEAFAPLRLHVLCEKPIATTLKDCQEIYVSLGGAKSPDRVFSTGHVLRYSPHNMLLRKLLLEDRAIGELISVEHTEPVGWFHFSHSYVRGNWRKESIAAPSLLCKSCHDIDFILWLLCYKTDFGEPAHLPSLVSSTGNLSVFTKRRKPEAAGTATNCFSCSHEQSCDWSAKKIYIEKLYDKGHKDFPVCVVVPDIEEITVKAGIDHGRAVLTRILSSDYDASTPRSTIEAKQWYGRCVWESDNDVLDDQIVTLTWDEDFRSVGGKNLPDRGPKTAVFHMVAFTEAQCERRGRISGTHGEIQYDSKEIRVYRFDKFLQPEAVQIFTPPKAAGGHGGGDGGLMNGFSKAVEAVINGKLSVEQAQARYVGCTLKEAFMSHAMVFAAEEARLGRKIVDWQDWWANLEQRLLSQ